MATFEMRDPPSFPSPFPYFISGSGPSFPGSRDGLFMKEACSPRLPLAPPPSLHLTVFIPETGKGSSFVAALYHVLRVAAAPSFSSLSLICLQIPGLFSEVLALLFFGTVLPSSPPLHHMRALPFSCLIEGNIFSSFER